MAAIDLLLNWSPVSERMHQVVLTGLFRHSPLLEMLGIPGEPVDLKIETQKRLYDFTVSMNSSMKVHVELKVDSPLGEDQIHRQLRAVAPGDMMVYVLLGSARYDWHLERLHGFRQSLDVATQADSIRLVDLIQMRQAMVTLANRASDYDHRDLAVAYGTLLRKLHERTEGYASKPITEWAAGGYEWFGFYDELTKRCTLRDVGFGYVPNQTGGFIACWWHWSDLALDGTSRAYLQLEEQRLCFKIEVREGDEALIRNAFSQAVLSAAEFINFAAVRPDRFGKGTTMTVAIASSEYRSPAGDTLVNWDHVGEIIRQAEGVLDRAVELWRNDSAGLAQNA